MPGGTALWGSPLGARDSLGSGASGTAKHTYPLGHEPYLDLNGLVVRLDQLGAADVSAV